MNKTINAGSNESALLFVLSWVYKLGTIFVSFVELEPFIRIVEFEIWLDCKYSDSKSTSEKHWVKPSNGATLANSLPTK